MQAQFAGGFWTNMEPLFLYKASGCSRPPRAVVGGWGVTICGEPEHTWVNMAGRNTPRGNFEGKGDRVSVTWPQADRSHTSTVSINASMVSQDFDPNCWQEESDQGGGSINVDGMQTARLGTLKQQDEETQETSHADWGTWRPAALTGQVPRPRSTHRFVYVSNCTCCQDSALLWTLASDLR